MGPIALRRLGSTDTFISALGLGCWQFSEGQGLVGRFWPAMPRNIIQDIIMESISGGINWFDTAAVYGDGASERALAQALVNLDFHPGDVVIATKWWPVFRFAKNIHQTIQNRLTALKPFPIDLYQVHQPYSLSSVKAQMNAMADLVDAQHIRHVGVSNFSPRQMVEAHKALQKRGIQLVSNQVKYNLYDRKVEKSGLVQLAKDLGITVIAYSPLEQGLLTGKFHSNPHLIQESPGPRKYLTKFREQGLRATEPLIAALERISWKYGATPSQVALNWLIHANGDTVIAIPGASSVKQASQNVGALHFVLSNEDIDELTQISNSIQKRV